MGARKNPQRRWKGVPKAERRRLMQEVTRARQKHAAARRLAKAVEMVRAAGYELQGMAS